MNEETDKITGKFFKSLLKECQEVLEKNGKKKKVLILCIWLYLID